MFRETLFRVGLGVSALYFGVFLYFLYNHKRHSWLVPEPMSQNELGDFLAGLFGPLAVLWLIIGILLQGKEFQNSVRELGKQAAATNVLIENDLMLARITFYRLVADVRRESETIREKMKRFGYAGSPSEQSNKRIAEALSGTIPLISDPIAAMAQYLESSILKSQKWVDPSSRKKKSDFVDEFAKIDSKIEELEKAVGSIRSEGRDRLELLIQSAVFVEAELALFQRNLRDFEGGQKSNEPTTRPTTPPEPPAEPT